MLSWSWQTSGLLLLEKRKRVNAQAHSFFLYSKVELCASSPYLFSYVLHFDWFVSLLLSPRLLSPP